MTIAIDPVQRSTSYVEKAVGTEKFGGVFNARYRLRLDQLASSGSFTTLALYGENEVAIVRVILEDTGAGNLIYAEAREDSGIMRQTAKMSVPSGWQRVQVGWRQGINSGMIWVTIGKESIGLFDLDNGQLGEIESYRWGVVSALSANASGYFDLDEFFTWNSSG